MGKIPPTTTRWRIGPFPKLRKQAMGILWVLVEVALIHGINKPKPFLGESPPYTQA